MKIELILTSILMLIGLIGFSQMPENEIKSTQLEITRSQLDSLVSVYSNIIKSNEELEAGDLITASRLANTISQEKLIKEYEGFTSLYYPEVLGKAIEVLEASPWKGGAFYSRKFDVFLGGTFHENSQYKLIE